jgi:hypothetical protein
MAYSYSDASKQEWPGPSINGLRQVKKLAKEFQAKRPALAQLLQHGHTNMLPALSVECTNLALKTTDIHIKHTLVHLASIARKADEIVVLEH